MDRGLNSGVTWWGRGVDDIEGRVTWGERITKLRDVHVSKMQQGIPPGPKNPA